MTDENPQEPGQPQLTPPEQTLQPPPGYAPMGPPPTWAPPQPARPTSVWSRRTWKKKRKSDARSATTSLKHSKPE